MVTARSPSMSSSSCSKSWPNAMRCLTWHPRSRMQQLSEAAAEVNHTDLRQEEGLLGVAHLAKLKILPVFARNAFTI